MESFSCSGRIKVLEEMPVFSEMRQIWDEIAQRAFPRKSNATYHRTTDFSQLIAADNYDSTLRRALVDHSAGTSALLFPVTEKGFRLKPPRRLKDDDDAIKACEECGEEMNYQLASNSNFRDALDEALLERVTFGTMGISTFYSDRHSRLDFRSSPINTYVVGKDPSGMVDEYYIRYEFTPEQAATEWGHDNLPRRVQDALLGKGEEREKQHDIYVVGIKTVYEWEEELKKAAKGKPVLYRVELADTKEVVLEDGFHEFPTSIGGYLPITGSAFGFTPTFFLLPEVRRLYRQQELADKLGLSALAPPLAALGKYKGQIRRGPLGITYVDDMTEAPVPLHLAGPEYKIGMERIQSARDDIERALHMDYFKMFSNLDDPKITATVANLMEAEKANALGSPYHRLSLTISAVIRRAFAILYRQGNFFPEMPESMMIPGENGTVADDPIIGMPNVFLPDVVFENRLVQAQRGIENVKVGEWAAVMAPILEIAPEELLNIDLEKLTRRTWRNTVGIEEAVVPLRKVKQMKQAAAAMQQQQAEMQQAQQAAEVGATASKAQI